MDRETAEVLAQLMDENLDRMNKNLERIASALETLVNMAQKEVRGDDSRMV